MNDELEVIDRGPVRWVWVDRYERRNAWTFDMGTQLDALLTDSAADPAVRVLVMAGRGGCFSAGIDRAELAKGLRTSTFPVERFLKFDKPTIACVDGLTFGMGFTLAVGCDLRVASTRATFTLGFSGIGLTPEWGSTFLLWREIGWSRALDIVLTNRTVDAADALRMGLVDRLTEPEQVEEAAQELAEQIASLRPGVAEAAKAVMWGALEQLTLAGSRAVELRGIYERRLQLTAEGFTPAKP